MAPIGPEQPGANLPAPYRSPWSVLAGDLVAVGADIGLRCRELWRRNRHGELPCPRFWPDRPPVCQGARPLPPPYILRLAGAVCGDGGCNVTASHRAGLHGVCAATATAAARLR